MEFPMERDCGVVSVCPPPTPSPYLRGFNQFHGAYKVLGHARGSITVQRSAFVELLVSGSAAKDLSFLDSLSHDAIQSLKLVGARITKDDLLALGHFDTLQCLRLEKCELSDELEASQIDGPPGLESLMFSVMQSGANGSSAILAWAKNCPKLTYVHDENRHLDAKSIRLFRRHRSPLFLSVDFAEDAHQVIEALKDVPLLRGLNIYVKQHVPDECLKELGSLANIEALTLSGGDIDSGLLEELRKIKNLRSLVLQGDAKLADSFPDGLHFLESLEKLSLPNERPFQEEQLHRALCSLPMLRYWPRLYKPSADTLTELATRRNIERIDISGLGDDAKIEQIAKAVRSSSSLESLELDKVPLGRELAEAISQATELDNLDLDVELFDGSLFHSMRNLRKLSRLSVRASQQARDLSVLGELPALNRLDISIPTYDFNAFSFLTRTKSLTSLVISNGFIDDRVAEWIADLDQLVALSCLSGCVMTDTGVEELLKCKNLRWLKIGGFITRACVERLIAQTHLESLDVSTDLLTESDIETLKEHGKRLRYIQFRRLQELGSIAVDANGVWRMTDAKWRSQQDELEGNKLEELLGEALSRSLTDSLQGKVVLVEFWGTWCGPCLAFKPELARLKQNFAGDGFEVLAIHSKQGIDRLDEYIKRNPKESWPCLVDSSGTLAKTFKVPQFPALYLFDRDGKLCVAQPHRLGLERAIRHYLDDK